MVRKGWKKREKNGIRSKKKRRNADDKKKKKKKGKAKEAV